MSTNDKKGLFARLGMKGGLEKSNQNLMQNLNTVFTNGVFTKRRLNEEVLQELEDVLITADLGVEVASDLVARLRADKFDKNITEVEIKNVLGSLITSVLTPVEGVLALSCEAKKDGKPHIVLFVGVNGAGKTTSLGKIAMQYRAQGQSVLLVAGDTFRAGAVAQLEVWNARAGTDIVSNVASKIVDENTKKSTNTDAAGLIFDALLKARQENYDIVLIDTAGRLQNRNELMDELAKITRVIKKYDADAPHYVILVLDANTGQNALEQTRVFHEITGVTGLIMTKLDGTAKGGILVALAQKFCLPIYGIGVGEGIEDLVPLNAQDFSNALLGIPASG